MNLRDELIGLMTAGVPLIHLVTHEEDRVIRTLKEIDLNPPPGIYSWDFADQFKPVREGSPPLPIDKEKVDDPLKHLAEKMPERTIVVLKDFHHAWILNKALVPRRLRNMVPALREKSQFLIMLTPEGDLPVELKDAVFTLHVPLPELAELEQVFAEVSSNLNKDQLPTEGVRERLVSASLGLTTNQARVAFARAFAKFRTFDEQVIDIVTDSKRAVIRESSALEFWPAQAGLVVGGLDQLKAWLAKREKGFTLEARQAGVPYPRGVALIGIPGTGKSLSAKMLAGMWKLPLLRLDVGAVFEMWLGASEANIRKATHLAEVVSPSILWVDEMEKAFAETGSGRGDSGSAMRVFGSFLTWMQEHTAPVFVIATANNVSALPPELMSRFERVFFLDLPNEVERRDILMIHLRKAGVPFPERSLRVDELVDLTDRFVGREIENMIREAQFTAFADGNREIEMEDLRLAIKELIPIAQSHVETIEELKRWKTEGRAFPATSDGWRNPATVRGRPLNVPG